jgi:hypothetical protein
MFPGGDRKRRRNLDRIDRIDGIRWIRGILLVLLVLSILLTLWILSEAPLRPPLLLAQAGGEAVEPGQLESFDGERLDDGLHVGGVSQVGEDVSRRDAELAEKEIKSVISAGSAPLRDILFFITRRCGWRWS